MDNGTLWIVGIIAFIILAIYVNQKEKKKYFKLYTDALKKKDEANAIAYGRKYYAMTEGRRNSAKTNIELTIQNDLKMAGIK